MRKIVINKHHKKMNLQYPSWLWFPLYHSEPKDIWNEDKEKIAQSIKKSLKVHLEFNCIKDNITEPNNYDVAGICYGGGEPMIVDYPFKTSNLYPVSINKNPVIFNEDFIEEK